MHILIDLDTSSFFPKNTMSWSWPSQSTLNNIISYVYISTHSFIHFSISISNISRITKSSILFNL